MNKERVSMTLSPDVIAYLDDNRGRQSRSAFAEDIILFMMDEE